MSKDNEPKLNKPLVSPKEPSVLTHDAIGTFKDEKTGEWMLAIIQFNPQTGTVGSIVNIPCGGNDRQYGIEKFKIEAYYRGLI